jgi:hypothetical protein
MRVITMARKPVEGSVARNMIEHRGTGGINVDAARVAMSREDADSIESGTREVRHDRKPGISLQLSVNPMAVLPAVAHPKGRFPANLILVHKSGCLRRNAFTTECAPGCPVAYMDGESGVTTTSVDDGKRGAGGIWHQSNGVPCGPRYGDTGTASRFFKQIGGQR